MKKILSNCPISCFADEISVSLDRQIQVLNELESSLWNFEVQMALALQIYR
ncbi:MAG: hypothetical protein ACLRZ6_13830 [Lachnospiraceae bacterium]